MHCWGFFLNFMSPMIYSFVKFIRSKIIFPVANSFVMFWFLTDLLKRSKPARIVIVASELYRFAAFFNINRLNTVRFWFPAYLYYYSKYVNVVFTLELARRLEGTGKFGITFSKKPEIICELVKDNINKNILSFWKKKNRTASILVLIIE